MNVSIDSAFPGGNIVVKEISGFHVTLERDLRDTEGPWFYWCFRARCSLPGTYHFRFADNSLAAIGTRGPAVSSDGGLSWHWLGAECADTKNESFTYLRLLQNPCGRRGRRPSHSESQRFLANREGPRPRGLVPGEVLQEPHLCDKAPSTLIFCMGIQYLQADLERFLCRHSGNPLLERTVLCHSRQGREVELLHVKGTSSPKWRILLTSRHHCGEAMATHVMEGFLDAALKDSIDGNKFREMFEVYAVPFVDKDGVENGDQGKNRKPRDHARDYDTSPIYSETKHIRQLVESEKIDIIFDLHCPCLRNDINETFYLVGLQNQRIQNAMNLFSDILETFAPPSAPFFAKDNILYGTSWNTVENYTQGRTLPQWASDLPFVILTAGMEIPFANARETTLDAECARAFGKALSEAVCTFAAVPDKIAVTPKTGSWTRFN